MKYDRILIRYGELSLKGRNRHKFVAKLENNIKYMLRDFRNVEIKADRQRMFLMLNGEDSKEINERLKYVFGVQSFTPAIKVNKEMDEIREAAVTLMKHHHQKGKSFKVATKRADKSFAYDTNDINHAVGAHILKNINDIHVDVKDPDIVLLVEILHEGAYISCEKIVGARGLPVGSAGKAMLMLSGGIDSPVAGYLSLKRGVEIEAVHFHSHPFTSERAKQKALDLAKKLAFYPGKMKVHIVPFTDIQRTIQEQIPEGYTMTTTRRMMLQITDEIRRRENGLAIVTGESLGQVASQTLESMMAINDVTTTPILRPLVAMDKNEIIAIAKKIDTYDISIRPYDDCCTIFTPPSPKTKPRKDKVRYYESFTDFASLIAEAVDKREILTLHAGETNESLLTDLF